MLGDYDLYATLPARDTERAREFFEAKLGLTPIGEDPAAIHYRSGRTYFDIYPTDAAGYSGHTLAGWVVDDIEAVVADLRERGVVFEEYDTDGLRTVNGVADLGSELTAWFKDSEGNVLAIAQFTPDFRHRD
jgi:catechol 2,3-dioxygenase-like lactoylglutathione lyase family enzyme